MPVEEIIQAATIEFQTPLTLEQTGELLDYISKNLPARITSTTEIHETRIQFYKSKEQKKERDYKERGTIKITGTISNPKTPMFGAFETTPYSKDTSKISAIRFPPTPGYSLGEHRPEKVLLWREVRQQVSNYFSQKQK